MKTYGLTLDEQQLDIIGRALSDVPYRIAAPVIQSIEMQIRAAEVPRPGGDTAAGTAAAAKPAAPASAPEAT